MKKGMTTTSIIIALVVAVALLLAIFLLLFPQIFSGGSDLKSATPKKTSLGVATCVIECKSAEMAKKEYEEENGEGSWTDEMSDLCTDSSSVCGSWIVWKSGEVGTTPIYPYLGGVYAASLCTDIYSCSACKCK